MGLSSRIVYINGFENRFITVESLHSQGLEGFEQMDFVEIALDANAVVSYLCLLRASHEREVPVATCLSQLSCKWRCVLWDPGLGDLRVWGYQQL